MTIAIITMVYNEALNLPIWIKHYRHIAPTSALFVVDDSSSDGSCDDLAGISRIVLPRQPMAESRRMQFMNNLQLALLQYYDVIIYTDCDELIIPDPNRSATIEEHLGKNTSEYISPIGLNIKHITEIEPPLDLNSSILSQRQFCQFHSRMCKPAITRVPLTWQPGFHASDRPINLDPALYLFHTKTMDKDCALERHHIALSIEWSTEAIAANHWGQHRFDDARFIREFFSQANNQFRTHGVGEFRFDDEIARVERETFERAGAFDVPAFVGPIVRIPERFRNAF